MNRGCATHLREAPKFGLLPVGRRDPLWHLAAEPIELARRHAPHVAVVDLAAATGSLGELYARLRRASPGTRMLLMSSGQRVSTRAARAAGASGFVSKRRGAREI